MPPKTYTRTFRIRYYECDSYGHVNNANYLRYMQETAFDASAAAGFGVARYSDMERLWLAHETGIEYLQPLRYNDTIQVTTWVADFRNVTSRRKYEFRRDGELMAQAYTDWVFIDSHTRRPTKITQDVIDAYFTDGDSPARAERKPFPAAPPPPAGVFTTRRRVAWRDIDMAGIVNNPVYLEYIEEAAFEVIAAHGWPVQRMTSEGFAILLRNHQIEYLLPARLDDELEIATWASGARRSTATRHYMVRRVSDGATIARIDTVGVWVNLASGKPIRIPQDFLNDFAPNFVANLQAPQS